MNGGPSQMDLLDLQAQDGRLVRQGPARLDSPGPAPDHDDQRPVSVPDRTLEVQVRPPRQVGNVGQRALALDGQDRRRDLPDQDGLDRGHQPRPGGDLHLHRAPASRAGEPGLLAELRAGHDEPEPAGLRRDDRKLDRAKEAPGDLQPALGRGLPAQQAPGSGSAVEG